MIFYFLDVPVGQVKPDETTEVLNHNTLPDKLTTLQKKKRPECLGIWTHVPCTFVNT